MKPFSVRGRLLLGAAMWTLGLFVIVSILITQVAFTHPRVPLFFHHLFAHALPMTLLAVVLLVVGALQFRKGVTAVTELRERLMDIHVGRATRLMGEYGRELGPLVDDLNQLLAAHEANVARAQARAGDLAHGLKTPLAVLAHEASRLAAEGHTGAAADLTSQIQRMRRQIEYHLAHARAAASSGSTAARTRVADSVDGLVRTLARLFAEKGVSMSSTVDSSHVVRVERQDLDEMLGNLLENACKWTRSRVDISTAAAAGRIAIVVDDDGPGLAAAMREAVLARGVRADEAAPGSGLGLAIVRDLAALYGGTIELGESPAGGLRATLTLP
jgi:signal transduction histidine kinase